MSYEKFVYIAGPFFNQRQLQILEQVKHTLDAIPMTYYSPKDELLYVPGAGIDPQEVLHANTQAMQDANIMVCIADGKDTGTMFEAGWAYRNGTPIFYVWIDHGPEDKFNLMLGASGVVAMSFDELEAALVEFILTDGEHLVIPREEINYE
jgi:nucleoside 2-deoxyribosyltransferase|tara:strand:- start:5666 stop:6118 length:453 start_codon:yes stop_codon:yes gene_type:complete